MKKKLILMTGVALIAITGNTVLYASNRDSVGADEVPPIVQQVNDHEERIGTLEETTEEVKQEVAETKTQVKQTKERTTVLENSTSATSEAIRQYREQQAIETPKLREGEITHVKHEVYPPGHMNGEFVGACIYQINTVTRYKSTHHGLLPGQSCLNVGDLISSLE